MKPILKTTGVQVGVAVMALTAAVHAKPMPNVMSPDGRIDALLGVTDGVLVWEVLRDNKRLLQAGRLGMKLADGQEAPVELVSWKTTIHREAVATAWGKCGSYDDHYQQGVAAIRETSGAKRTWRVVIRAYDSGVALRYEFPKDGGWGKEIKLTGEQTEFRFVTDGRAWCYAGEHEPKGPQPLSKFHAEKGARPPLVVECGKKLNVAVLEAAIFDIAPFDLVPVKGKNTSFQAKPGGSILKAGGHTSWRVLMVGETPGDLLVSPLPYCLNPPCEIADTSWIRPGLAMWDWRAWGAKVEDGFTYGLDMPSWRRMIDFASKNGVAYLVLDANWYGPEFEKESDPRTSRDHLLIQPDPTKAKLVRRPAPDPWDDPIDVPALIKYGKEKGVGVVLYFNDIARLNWPFEETLALYQKWGAAGIKYGFMKGKGQQKVLDTRTIVEACARHQLSCDFHDGPVPPSGDMRTYPNYLAREFCHAQSDARRVFSPSGFCETVFVNMLAGPLDMNNGLYTLNNPAEDRPKIFRNVETTVVAETARVMITYSGMGILPDCPEAYEAKAGLFDFLKNMPGSWDETRILHGRIGEYITTARRKGKAWYIASANNEEARTLDVKLDFLDDGTTYTAKLYEDAPDAHFKTKREAYRVRETSAVKGVTIKAKMAPGGGHCIKVVPVP